VWSDPGDHRAEERSDLHEPAQYGQPARASSVTGRRWPALPVRTAGEVQEWVNSGVTATTPAFSAKDKSGNNESTTDRWKKFDVGSTWLVIKYNSIPDTPAADSLSAPGISATVGCYTAGTSGQPYVNASGGVHLKATLTDNDAGDNLVARFEWQDVTANSAVVTIPDTPGPPPPGSLTVACHGSDLHSARILRITGRADASNATAPTT